MRDEEAIVLFSTFSYIIRRGNWYFHVITALIINVLLELYN